MTKDDIIRMAREAGLWTSTIFDPPLSVERFAQLVEEAATEKANERANKSWALMCEKMVAAERELSASNMKHVITEVNNMIDAAIRARGQQ